ncbi:AAA domain-containing protein [Nocardia higoensis]|uniref:AAA domain-containing protein n=1 Tax=Nocardia higoensis TaxID=228599 RepID=UPI0002FAAD8D|nr:AAA domain-containing protein [Nocardia higoensis]
MQGGGAPLADRGARLFEYLARVQAIGTTRVTEVENLGSVIWMSDLPAHQVVRYEPEAAGGPFLVVGKVRVEPVVELHDARVREWLVPGPIDDPENEPELRQTRTGPAGVEKLEDHPEVLESFHGWLVRWRPWAAKARRDLLAHKLYRELYDIHTRLSAASETTEAVLGLGCLSWKPPQGATVRRHVLTVPVKVDFDASTGALSVVADADGSGLTVELMDFLENNQISNPGMVRDAENFARQENVYPFDRGAVGNLVRRVINGVAPESAYLDQLGPEPPRREPTGAYAPAVILRPRGTRGLVRVLNSIAGRIRDQGSVPEGIRNLVDPDYVPARDEPSDEGAVVRDGGDSFLPMPLNEVQLRILDHVDSSAHTIVQGPPGTGKTHTAAALITHLLAQGKRVLITAHTDRALEEVRGKLPEEIKALSVAVVGTSRDSFSDLEVAVARISDAADEHDAQRSARRITAAQRRIAELCQARADIKRRLREARESEVRQFDIAGYRGTLTAIVERHRDDRDRLGWIDGLVSPGLDAAPPLSARDAAHWRELLLDRTLNDPEVAAPNIVGPSELPPPEQIEQWFARQTAATEKCREYQEIGQTEWVRRIQPLPPAIRTELCALVQGQDRAAAELVDHRESWIADALFAVRSGRPMEWQARGDQIAEFLMHADAAVAAVGISDVTVNSTDLAPLVSLAEAVLAHIAKKGEIKTQADGSPKAGLTTAKVIKDAKPLFDLVRVDGRIPTTAEQLETFRSYEKAGRLLNQLDAVWHGIAEPTGGSPGSRLARHRERLSRLRSVLSFGSQLRESGDKLRLHGLPEPDWADPGSVRRMVEAFDAVTALDELRAAQAPIGQLLTKLTSWSNAPQATATVRDLRLAVERGDVRGYHRARARSAELRELREKRTRRDDFTARMAAVPALRDSVLATVEDPGWVARLESLPAAWGWAATGRWLAERVDEQVNELFRELDSIEDRLRKEATELAVTRAWDRAVGPGRLTPSSRADLLQYVQLVRKLGKGTGIHAGRRRADIKQTLARCRSAVPVWIMPIYRVVEQLDIEQDMFDVVVVDEASQAGLESVFLQYLAPRIVVIGDDKQVSPSAVGIDQKELDSLAGQYLADDKYRATWQEAKRSLFDEATMRFPARLTLVEHRRCVPEIIGFSNKIAYEPQNVKLIPVRLFGADRLPPIRTVHVPDGVSTGRSNIVNAVEAERIVAQIAECMRDPAYDGKTFGVISLLGSAQAKLIWDRLMARFQPEELARRQLRCGDAADFQGAERDVIFLSMVKSKGEDSRLVAQNREEAVQRYNVAVSRARDQLWLFHSITLDDLRNHTDMRYQLLDYCLDGWKKGAEQRTGRPEPVTEERVVAPFDSLFEQQVFNRIVDRGYRVTAHYDATGYEIDMVVTGDHARVAVQCDGDRWDGPTAFEADLARQRDLQRCGWPFVRIRQSQFLRDPDAALEPLWETFDALGLEPIGPEQDVVSTDEPEDPVRSEDAERRGGYGQAGESLPTTTLGRPVLFDEAELLDQGVLFERSTPAGEPGGSAPSAVEPEPAAAVAVAVAESAVTPYRAFTEPLAGPEVASSGTVAKDLVRIVEVEGPVSGARLLAAYLRAGGAAADEDLTGTVEHLLVSAVERGDLLVDDPLALGDPALRTYRTPDQPLTDRRTLGPRSVEQVPVRELAEVLADVAAETGWRDRKDVLHRALRILGQSEITDRAVAAFALALPLARQASD